MILRIFAGIGFLTTAAALVYFVWFFELAYEASKFVVVQ